MTPDSALRLVAHLVCFTNGWDDASALAWTNKLADLSNEVAAVDAVERLIGSWTHGTRPTWGRLMEHYHAVPRDAPPALPGKRETIMSFNQYIEALTGRAAMGDDQARRDLESWKHHVSSSSSFLKAIGGFK